MSEIEPTTLRHNVGKCPACRAYLWAEVIVQVSVSKPTMTEDGRALVGAYASPVSMSVTHYCDQREPLADWEVDILREVAAEQHGEDVA